MSKFFAPVPLEFDQAFKNGQTRPGAYLIGCHLAAESYRNKNTDDGLVTAYVSALADLCEASAATIRRTLRALERAGWIECDVVEERQRGPWRIRLTGLAKDPACATTASPALRHVTQSPIGADAVRDAVNPAQQAPTHPPHERPMAQLGEGTDETRRDQKSLRANPRSEEKLDHAISETTEAEIAPVDQSEPEFPRLLDALEPNPFHESDLLSDEEITRLGTASLAELRSRHERREL
jgi:hypothetical protein